MCFLTDGDQAIDPIPVSLWEITTVNGPKIEGAEEWRERLEEMYQETRKSKTVGGRGWEKKQSDRWREIWQEMSYLYFNALCLSAYAWCQIERGIVRGKKTLKDESFMTQSWMMTMKSDSLLPRMRAKGFLKHTCSIYSFLQPSMLSPDKSIERSTAAPHTMQQHMRLTHCNHLQKRGQVKLIWINVFH